MPKEKERPISEDDFDIDAILNREKSESRAAVWYCPICEGADEKRPLKTYADAPHIAVCENCGFRGEIFDILEARKHAGNTEGKA